MQNLSYIKPPKIDSKCPICKSKQSSFLPLPDKWKNMIVEIKGENYYASDGETLSIDHYFCDKCLASDRERLYALFLESFFSSLDKNFKLLHFAPEEQLKKFIKKYQNITYRSADLFMTNVDDKVDITNMDIYDDNSFDFIICSHILEHIPEDKKALAEIYRILEKDGYALLMVPIIPSLDHTYEDVSIVDPQERLLHFGQEDHVRMYSKNDYIKLLENSGFKVHQLGSDFFGREIFQQYGIEDKSILYIVEKVKKPTVQIVMVTYNQENYIQEAIESVLMQETGFDFELLIGEDASSDKTSEIVKEYASKYPDKITAYIRQKNLGAAENFLDLYNKVSSTYIAFLEGDDFWTDSKKLQKQVDFLEQNSDYSMVLNRATLLKQNESTELYPDKNYTEGSYTLEDIINVNFTTTSSVMYRNNFLKLPQGSELLDMFDWVLHIFYANGGKIYLFDDLMSIYRIHDSSKWSGASQIYRIKRTIESFQLINEYFNNSIVSLKMKQAEFELNVINNSLVNKVDLDLLAPLCVSYINNISLNMRDLRENLQKIFYLLHTNQLFNIFAAVEKEIVYKLFKEKQFDELALIETKYTEKKMIEKVKAKYTVAYIANPLDIDKYRELTLGLMAPITRLKDYEIVQLIDLVEGKFKVNQEVLRKCSTIVVFDTGAIYHQLITDIKILNIPIVFYISKDVWHVPYKDIDYEKSLAWKNHYAKIIELADSIVVTNEYIQQSIEDKPTTLITPFVETSLWEKSIKRKENKKGKLSVAIFVTPSSLNNLQLIIEPVKSLQVRYDESVEFFVYAVNSKGADLQGLDFMSVEITLKTINNYLDYLTFIRTVSVDIALCPLLPQRFSVSLAQFKYFENALSKVAGIYSNTGSYRKFIKHNETGLLIGNDSKSWENAIERLINDTSLREKIIKNAEIDVRNNFSVATNLRPMQELLDKNISLPSQERIVSNESTRGFSRYDISSFEVYQEYIKQKSFKKFDEYLWQDLSSKWHSMISFSFFIEVPFIDTISINQLANTIEALEKQIYPEWKLYLVSGHASINSTFEEAQNLQWIQTELNAFEVINELLPSLHETFVGILHLGDELVEQALGATCNNYNVNGAKLIYSDHDSISSERIRNFPKFKPDINLEMLRATNYIDRAFVIHSSALNELNGFNIKLKQAEIYDLLLRFIDSYGEDKITHCAELLYSLQENETDIVVEKVASKLALTQHIQRNNIVAEVVEGEIEKTYRILYHHEIQPLVSILIPTKNQYKYLQPCIETILEKTAYPNYEIIIVDNASDEDDAVKYLQSLEANENIHIIYYDKPFNYSTVNNVAAKQAKGEYLLLLNNDTEVLHENWLDVMMSHAQRDEVGIVGARLLYPNGGIQHAGVIVGLSTVADHQFENLDVSDEGYMMRLKIEQELSAVTAAAFLVKRDVFNEMNGLNDIAYKVNFSDVDFCLKVREAGYKIIWTPHVTLLHHGSVTQKNIDPVKVKARNTVFEADKSSFITKWKHWILHDPAFNNNLDIFDSCMSTRINGLTHWNIEQKSSIPKLFAMTRDFDGGGYYRVLSPLGALEESGYIQFATTYKAYQPAYINYTQPDVIVYQTPLHEAQINFLKYMKKYFPHVTLIYEIDDLLTNIPIDNKAFLNQYKNSAIRIKKALQYCDKLVVSTQPLKDAFAKYSDNVSVVPNYLSKNIWGNLTSQRNQSEKLRVGWAGSMFHKGDLKIIQRLIEDYKESVQWVFMGMAPEGLDDIIEYHKPVALDKYPQELASLNLDLALVPLEVNAFNEAKSNLRLLEFGILGWPVICTDIYPYQKAPVQRVKNRYKDWKKAFEDTIADRENLHTKGDILKKWVVDNYILEDNLEKIAHVYLK